MKKLTSVSPYVFENFLIISLDLEWLKLYKTIPTFEIFIDEEGKLHMISKERIKNDYQVY